MGLALCSEISLGRLPRNFEVIYDWNTSNECTEIDIIYLCIQQCHENAISGLNPIFS